MLPFLFCRFFQRDPKDDVRYDTGDLRRFFSKNTFCCSDAAFRKRVIVPDRSFHPLLNGSANYDVFRGLCASEKKKREPDP